MLDNKGSQVDDNKFFVAYEVACEEGPGLFAHLLTFLSLLLILLTLPISLVWVVKVVQESNRDSRNNYSLYLCIFESFPKAKSTK